MGLLGFADHRVPMLGEPLGRPATASAQPAGSRQRSLAKSSSGHLITQPAGSAPPCRTRRRTRAWRNASRACSSGSAVSICGRMPVDSQNRATRSSSSRVPIVEPTTRSCRKKTRRRSVDRLVATGRTGHDDRAALCQALDAVVPGRLRRPSPSPRRPARAAAPRSRTQRRHPSSTARARLASSRPVTHMR